MTFDLQCPEAAGRGVHLNVSHRRVSGPSQGFTLVLWEGGVRGDASSEKIVFATLA